MKKNTLGGKIKVLSYFIAFVIMVGVNIAMDKIGGNGDPSSEIKQKVVTYPDRTDNSMTKISSSLSNDSMYIHGNESTEIVVLLK